MNAAISLKHCPQCNSPMPPDELRCIRCGFQLPPSGAQNITDDFSNTSQAAVGNVAGMRWWAGVTLPKETEKHESRGWCVVFVAVLTSNVFFWASCTVGFIAAYVLLEKVTGQYMDQGATPSDLMVIIATIPDPDKQGDVKLKHVPLRDMEKFKAENPAHSFLLPLGPGRIPIHSESSVTYKVEPAGEGKVLVETKYLLTMGGLVNGRYEATEKTVRPIFTNNVAWMVPFFIGVILASVLHLIGRVLRFLVSQRHPEAH